jgi:hypothetical protein
MTHLSFFSHPHHVGETICCGVTYLPDGDECLPCDWIYEDAWEGDEPVLIRDLPDVCEPCFRLWRESFG